MRLTRAEEVDRVLNAGCGENDGGQMGGAFAVLVDELNVLPVEGR
jgi:hypothetical protein